MALAPTSFEHLNIYNEAGGHPRKPPNLFGRCVCVRRGDQGKKNTSAGWVGGWWFFGRQKKLSCRFFFQGYDKCYSSISHMGVYKNRGTPKSSILIGCFIIFTIHFQVPLFLETSILSCMAVDPGPMCSFLKKGSFGWVFRCREHAR